MLVNLFDQYFLLRYNYIVMLMGKKRAICQRARWKTVAMIVSMAGASIKL